MVITRFEENGEMSLHVETKMGAVVLGFRWLWQSFQIAASVRLTMTPFPISAHQTGRAVLPHPAFRLTSPHGTRQLAHNNRYRASIPCAFSAFALR